MMLKLILVAIAFSLIFLGYYQNTSNSYNKKSVDLIGTVFYPLNDNDILRENRTDEDLPKFGGEVKY